MSSVLIFAKAKEPRMKSQNVAVFNEKSRISVRITVPLSKSSLVSLFPQILPALLVLQKSFKKLEFENKATKSNACWVDSMRASSPTRVRSASALLSETDEHSSWIVGSVPLFCNSGLLFLTVSHFSQMIQTRHPSALSMFHQIVNASKRKQIVMFLDYDGTLSPIVEDPDRAFMTNEVHYLFHLLHLLCFLLPQKNPSNIFPESDARSCKRHRPMFPDRHSHRTVLRQGTFNLPQNLLTSFLLLPISVLTMLLNCAGLQLCKIGRPLLRRKPWNGHQRTI